MDQFTWRKVVSGGRVTRLPELPWVSLFIHFLTKHGEQSTWRNEKLARLEGWPAWLGHPLLMVLSLSWYPASRGFSLACLLAFTKSFASPISRVVNLCSQGTLLCSRANFSPLGDYPGRVTLLLKTSLLHLHDLIIVSSGGGGGGGGGGSSSSSSSSTETILELLSLCM